MPWPSDSQIYDVSSEQLPNILSFSLPNDTEELEEEGDPCGVGAPKTMSVDATSLSGQRAETKS